MIFEVPRPVYMGRNTLSWTALDTKEKRAELLPTGLYCPPAGAESRGASRGAGGDGGGLHKSCLSLVCHRCPWAIHTQQQSRWLSQPLETVSLCTGDKTVYYFASINVIITTIKYNWGLTFPRRVHPAGKSGQKLKARPGGRHLSRSHGEMLLDHQPIVGTAHSRPGLPTSINHQENTLRAFL